MKRYSLVIALLTLHIVNLQILILLLVLLVLSPIYYFIHDVCGKKVCVFFADFSCVCVYIFFVLNESKCSSWNSFVPWKYMCIYYNRCGSDATRHPRPVKGLAPPLPLKPSHTDDSHPPLVYWSDIDRIGSKYVRHIFVTYPAIFI